MASESHCRECGTALQEGSCPVCDWGENRTEEAAQQPSDDELLKQLDAYGHMTWSVGDDDWTAYFDACAFEDPDGVVRVAYHTVVNCESAGFLDEPEKSVVKESDAPFGLPWKWADVAMENSVRLDTSELTKTVEAWDKHLREIIEEAKRVQA